MPCIKYHKKASLSTGKRNYGNLQQKTARSDLKKEAALKLSENSWEGFHVQSSVVNLGRKPLHLYSF